MLTQRDARLCSYPTGNGLFPFAVLKKAKTLTFPGRFWALSTLAAPAGGWAGGRYRFLDHGLVRISGGIDLRGIGVVLTVLCSLRVSLFDFSAVRIAPEVCFWSGPRTRLVTRRPDLHCGRGGPRLHFQCHCRGRLIVVFPTCCCFVTFAFFKYLLLAIVLNFCDMEMIF